VNSRRQTLALRLEYLRLRGEVERHEAATALAEVREHTLRLRTLGGLAGNLAGAMSNRSGGWLGVIADAIVRRPWLAALALRALRAARRHPWLVLGVVGAAWLTRRRTDEGRPKPAPRPAPECDAPPAAAAD
jgi:hypothetical protein